jgi:hypothetical protein
MFAGMAIAMHTLDVVGIGYDDVAEDLRAEITLASTSGRPATDPVGVHGLTGGQRPAQ